MRLFGQHLFLFLVFFALLVKYCTHDLHVLHLRSIALKIIISNGETAAAPNFLDCLLCYLHSRR